MAATKSRNSDRWTRPAEFSPARQGGDLHFNLPEFVFDEARKMSYDVRTMEEGRPHACKRIETR
jgi:hypothetical protein